MANKTLNKVRKKIKEFSSKRKKIQLLLLLSYVGYPELFKLEKILKKTNHDELDVIIHTQGGSADVAFQIAKCLLTSCKKLNIIVPFLSKSAGSIICLAADNIVLTPLSELGPLDTQIKEDQDGGPAVYRSALNEFQALEQIRKHCLESLNLATLMILSSSGMKIPDSVELATNFVGNTSANLYSQLDTKRIGAYFRALEIGKQYGVKILTRYKGWDRDKANATISRLVWEYPSHSYIIDKEELESLGLPVKYLNAKQAETIESLRTEFVTITKEQSVIEFVEGSKKK